MRLDAYAQIVNRQGLGLGMKLGMGMGNCKWKLLPGYIFMK